MSNRVLFAVLLSGLIAVTASSDRNASKSNAHIDTTRAEAVKFVLDHLAAFEAGDLDRWGAGMTDDVFMIAADPAEAIAGRAAILAELHKDFDPAFEAGLKLSIKPTFSQIGVSHDLNAAWTAHVLAYTIMFGADTLKFALRNTNVLIKQNGRWRIVAANYSQPISRQEMIGAFTSGKFPSPAPIANAVSLTAENLVEQFRKDVKDLSQADLHAEVLVMGPEPQDPAIGIEAAKNFFARWAREAGQWRERGDGIRAGASADGQVGCVITNLEWRAKVDSMKTVVPQRAVLVYQNEKGAWKLTQTHISVGVPDPE